MNTRPRRFALATSTALALALALAGCGAGTTSEPEPDTSVEQSNESLTRARGSACHDAGACLPTNAACELSGRASTCCDPAARCIEYTVYDYPRCRKPYATGDFCYRNDQCASNHCVASSCAP
jgi:hypothetical protein